MKTKINPVVLIGVAILLLFAISKGGIFSGAMVCTSNEPNSAMDFNVDQLSSKLGYLCEIGEDATGRMINCFASGTGGTGKNSILISTLGTINNVKYTSCNELLTKGSDNIVYKRSYSGVSIYKSEAQGAELVEMFCPASDNFWILSQSTTYTNKYIDTMYTCTDTTTTTPTTTPTPTPTQTPTSTTNKEWYENPIIWVVIVIALFLFRGN